MKNDRGEPTPPEEAVSYLQHESERRFREMVDALPAAIYTTDAEGRVTHFNSAAAELSGRTPQIGTDEWCVSWKLYRADGTPLPHDKCPMAVALKRGQAVRGEEIIVERPDGTRLWCAPYPTPLRDSAGTIVGGINMLVDITEQKAFGHANRRKDEFLAMLAHELRNPLAPILVSLEVLRRANVTAAGSAIDVLERQVGQMVRLVDDLLDASRISRGRIDLRRERVELSSVIHHAVEAVGSLAAAKGQELDVRLPTEPVFVDADPARLAQLVGNLLNNACKFTGSGGRVSLTVERETDREGRHGVVIRVRDTGIGIAADELSRVFEMFAQADTSLERSSAGLGIGLTLAKTLAEMHGGTVEASSAGLGHGSEFVIRLPIVLASLAYPERLAPAESMASVPLRVLIVDDNRDAAAMLSMLLSFSGHDTHTVHDGLSAVEAATALEPDLILLDIGLPGINGYEAARRIRQGQTGTARRPVLFAVTGWGQEEDRRRSHEAGFDDHLVKPVDAAALGRKLAELGARKQTARGTTANRIAPTDYRVR